MASSVARLMPTHTSLARARKLRHPARSCRCPNLDFGRSWRRPLIEAAKSRAVARIHEAGEHRRDGENHSSRRITDRRRAAHGHERAILAATGHRGLIRTARHVGRHCHRCVIAHGRRHGGRGRRDRSQDQANDGERRKQIADGGQAVHPLPIAQLRSPGESQPTQRCYRRSASGRRCATRKRPPASFRALSPASRLVTSFIAAQSAGAPLYCCRLWTTWDAA